MYEIRLQELGLIIRNLKWSDDRVESGEVELVFGDEVSAWVRRLLDARLADMETHS